jgi:N-acetylmuramoyl-L-alanine amidase
LRRNASLLIVLIVVAAALLQAQGTAPATPLSLVSRDGRRAIQTTLLSGQELIALDDVATLFQVTVREDTLAGGLTVTYRGRSIIISTDQPMASVTGRVVALPSPAVRGAGNRWLVPVEFLPRALAPIYDTRIELRRASRLLIVGDVRVPRVTAQVDQPGPPTRATIEVLPAANPQITSEAGRVLIRLDADALDLGLPADGGGLIDEIRQGDQPTTVTVVLDPRAGQPRIASVTTDGITRITIDVPLANAPADTAAPPVPLPPAPADGLPPLLATTPRAPLQTIVIDPGHGGMDTGVKGGDGLEEKTLTLDVARRLRTLIEGRMGVRVLLTRDEDRAVELDDRAALANNSKADLFISLHANAAASREVAGAEVYYLRLDREGEEVLRSAESEAVSVPVLGGGTRSIDVIRWDLAQARHIGPSIALASMLEESLRARIPMSARPVKDAPLRVLSGANMPAVLIEMAYLTNAQQEDLARGAEYQEALAQAVYDAILRFRTYLEEQASR